MKMGKRYIGVVCILTAWAVALFLWDKGAQTNPIALLTPARIAENPFVGIYRFVGLPTYLIHRWMGVATYGFPVLLLHIGWRLARGANSVEIWRRALMALLLIFDLSLLGSIYDRLLGTAEDASGGPFGALALDAIAKAAGTPIGAILVIVANWFGLRWSGIADSLGIPRIEAERLGSGLREGCRAIWAHLSGFVKGVAGSTPTKSRRRAPPRKEAQQKQGSRSKLTSQVSDASYPKGESTDTTGMIHDSDSSRTVFETCELNKRRRSAKSPPPSSIIDAESRADAYAEDESLAAIAEAIVGKLREFKVDGDIAGHVVGPLVTRYELRLAPGVKISQVRNLSDDLAVALGSPSVRFEIPIPGKNTIGIEIPNTAPTVVPLHGLIDGWEDESPLAFPLGVDVVGAPKFGDLGKMPHLLVAGATNSGKSVFLNALLSSLLLKSGTQDLRLILSDVKRTELTPYDGIPHLLCPVLTEPKAAEEALEWAVQEMDSRFETVTATHSRNISEYNAGCSEVEQRLPYLVVIVDELADLMMQADKGLEQNIVRLAQKARAVGIHLILATQRPSTDVVTGMIKANFPSRIAFHVSSMVDSRVVLDENGAEKLVGRGDMLYKSAQGHELTRLHGAFISTDETMRIVSHWC